MPIIGAIKEGVKTKIAAKLPNLFPASRTTFDNSGTDFTSNRVQGALADAIGKSVYLSDADNVEHGGEKRVSVYNVDHYSQNTPTITFGTLIYQNYSAAYGQEYLLANTGIYRRVYASNAWEANWTKLV